MKGKSSDEKQPIEPKTSTFALIVPSSLQTKLQYLPISIVVGINFKH